ncbi:MAG: FAD-binding oxidoreductase [Rhodospirillales bacterium]|nr:FAD-binding oxidoreductase [Rhodospirillales bacterium]
MSELKLTPYWWEAAPRPEARAIAVPEKTDVCIVGAGYAGLSAALHLARAGRSVVVFDAMRAGEGASSRNGGIASGNIKFSFNAMISKFGLQRAKDFYAEGIAARDHLAALIRAEKIDCGFKMVGRFTGANSDADYEMLGREADALNQHLELGVEMVSHADQHRELGTDHYVGGQVRGDIGGLHPGLLHQGLLERVVAAGVLVICETRVSGVAKTDAGFVVTTPKGPVLAQDVIIATNGYTDGLISWLQRRIIPIPSQIIATEALPAGLMDQLMPKRRMLGNTLNLYNYYRPSPDDQCIIFGGRRGADTDDPQRKTRALREQLIEVFPQLQNTGLTHSWWGYTGYTFDFLPKVMVNDGIHYALGFCGSGVVWANWLGLKAALSILGETDAESIFAKYPFQTRPLYRGYPWFLPFVIRWYAIKDKLGKGRHG